MSTQPEPSNLKAAMWVSGWVLLMVTMAVAGREAAWRIDAFQVMLLRAIIGFILLQPIVWMSGGYGAMKTALPLQHMFRNAIHYSSQYLWLLAVTIIPIAQVVAIEFTMPIWTAILAVLFLGERMNQWKVAAIVLGLIGVWIIVRPGAGQASFGQIISLIAAFGFAVSVFLTKTLSRTESAARIIFWMLIIQGIIGLIPALMYWKPIPVDTWKWLVIVAACGTFSHFCMAQAVRFADTTVVVPMDFLRVPLTAIAGWAFYNEIIDVYTMIGAALILTGNLLNLRKAPPKPAV